MPIMLKTLRNFASLRHRCELITEKDGIAWYNDSKGTNVGATVAALTGLGGLGRKIVLIAGGDGKGQDFSPLVKAVAKHARAAVLIGRDGPLIEKAILASGVAIESATDMGDAVRRAHSLAQDGDAVLLSPACASFDMFRNYEHRAQVFVAAVHALEGAGRRAAPRQAQSATRNSAGGGMNQDRPLPREGGGGEGKS